MISIINVFKLFFVVDEVTKPRLSWDYYTFLGNYTPTPHLSQHLAQSEK